MKLKESDRPAEIAGYKIDPLANFFPMLNDKEFNELCSDIEDEGLQIPIVLHEGRVLDGRNRLKACHKTGVAPRFVELKDVQERPLMEDEFKDYDGQKWDIDPRTYVISTNISRRHLPEDDRQLIIATINAVNDPWFSKEAAEERKKEAKPKKGEVRNPSGLGGKSQKKDIDSGEILSPISKNTSDKKDEPRPSSESPKRERRERTGRRDKQLVSELGIKTKNARKALKIADSYTKDEILDNIGTLDELHEKVAPPKPKAKPKPKVNGATVKESQIAKTLYNQLGHERLKKVADEIYRLLEVTKLFPS